MPDEAVQHSRLAGTDVAQDDGVEEGGGAARRGVVGGVVVSEERGRLAYGLGELRQLLHGLHGGRLLPPLAAADLAGWETAADLGGSRNGGGGGDLALDVTRI